MVQFECSMLQIKYYIILTSVVNNGSEVAHREQLNCPIVTLDSSADVLESLCSDDDVFPCQFLSVWERWIPVCLDVVKSDSWGKNSDVILCKKNSNTVRCFPGKGMTWFSVNVFFPLGFSLSISYIIYHTEWRISPQYLIWISLLLVWNSSSLSCHYQSM